MENPLSPECTAVPNVVIDRWMPVLPATQFRLVLYFLRCGFDRPPGLPDRDRWKAASLAGLLPRSAYPAIRRMTESGLVIVEPHEGALHYRLNLDWCP